VTHAFACPTNTLARPGFWPGERWTMQEPTSAPGDCPTSPRARGCARLRDNGTDAPVVGQLGALDQHVAARERAAPQRDARRVHVQRLLALPAGRQPHHIGPRVRRLLRFAAFKLLTSLSSGVFTLACCQSSHTACKPVLREAEGDVRSVTGYSSSRTSCPADQPRSHRHSSVACMQRKQPTSVPPLSLRGARLHVLDGGVPVLQVPLGRHPVPRLAVRATKGAVVKDDRCDACRGEAVGKAVQRHVLLAADAVAHHHHRRSGHRLAVHVHALSAGAAGNCDAAW